MTPLLRILYLFYRIYSGIRYRAVRRFTRPGLAVGGALMVATMVATDTENTIAYQAFTVLLALLLMAMVFALWFRGRFNVSRALPRFATVGQPFEYPVTVRNNTKRPQASLTLLENLMEPRPSYRDWRQHVLEQDRLVKSFRFNTQKTANPFSLASVSEAPVPTMQPKSEAEARIQLTPLRRGVLQFSGVTIARADPLGVFRSFIRLSAPESTLILPKRYPLPPVALPGAMKYQQGGVAMSSNIGRSEEFVSLRDYRRGDPLRQIHWRSWAKTGRPIVKECEDEFFVRHALILDTFTRLRFSQVFEESISVAASFACTILSQESLLDLLFVGAQTYCFTAGRGLAHSEQMLEILASVQPCRDRPFSELEQAVINHSGQVSGCICVLQSWDSDRRELVRKLRMLDVPVLVLVVVPAGTNMQLDPGPMLDAPDQFHVLEVGRIEEGLARLS